MEKLLFRLTCQGFLCPMTERKKTLDKFDHPGEGRVIALC